MSEVIHCPVAHRTMWEALNDKDYREGFAEGYVEEFLASQIYSLRIARGWSQKELADKAEVTQPMISDWENSCDGIRLASLEKLAGAFDVALLCKFVPFSVLAREAISARADLPVPSFEEDSREAIGFGTFRIVAAEGRDRGHRNGANGYLQMSPPASNQDTYVSMRG